MSFSNQVLLERTPGRTQPMLQINQDAIPFRQIRKALDSKTQANTSSTGWWSDASLVESTRISCTRGARSSLTKTKSQVNGGPGHCTLSQTPTVGACGSPGWVISHASRYGGVASS